MRIQLIAVGSKMPGWVEQGYDEYARRLPAECSLGLSEVALTKRPKNGDVQRLIRAEGEKMLAAVPKGARVVTLEVNGRPWSTEQLSSRLEFWLGEGRDLALLVGGPEGLAPAAQQVADERWSLSPLTLPHPLVRIVVAEQIYRAWSILKGHPYHK